MTNGLQFDLEDLRVFAAVAEQGNLTRGAQQVNLAPSSTSHRIATLEQALGTTLFVRLPRGVQLTPAGESLLRHARQILAQVQQLNADLAPHAHGVRGHVRLWANTHATHTYLPEDLAAYLRDHPSVSVTLEERPSPEIVMAVAKGEVELGLVAGEMTGVDVRFMPYRTDRLVLIVPPHSPWAEQQSLSFAEVLREPFVMLHVGSAIHTFTVNAAAALGHSLDVRIQVRSFEAVIRMVAAGVGVGLVPRSALRAIERTEVAVLDLAEPWAERNLQVCLSNSRPVGTYAQLLIAHLLRAGAGQEGEFV